MIHFVGVHFKEGMTALDERSLSGRIISRIAEGLNSEYDRLNLFPTCHLPNAEVRKIYADKFVSENDNDLYVLLGKVVSYYLSDKLKNSIVIDHPGYVMRKGKDAIDNYVCWTTKLLNGKITPGALKAKTYGDDNSNNDDEHPCQYCAGCNGCD